MGKSVLLLALLPCVVSAEPLAIKGVTIGDSIDRISLLGVCRISAPGMCAGKTSYGPAADADFIVGYMGGRITSVNVMVPSSHSAEIITGLTKRHGPPDSGGCKSKDANCRIWRCESAELVVVPARQRVGVMLRAASPAAGY